LPRKGQIAPGFDADLALVRLGGEFEINPEDLFYRHPQSPYVSHRVQARVEKTWLRGQLIFNNGTIAAKPSGQLVRPVTFRATA
jgi:allantoinase